MGWLAALFQILDGLSEVGEMHLHVIVNIVYIWGYCDIERVFFMGSIVFGDCGVVAGSRLGMSW